MNSSFPNRWSFSYLKFTKYVTNIINLSKRTSFLDQPLLPMAQTGNRKYLLKKIFADGTRSREIIFCVQMHQGWKTQTCSFNNNVFSHPFLWNTPSATSFSTVIPSLSTSGRIFVHVSGLSELEGIECSSLKVNYLRKPSTLSPRFNDTSRDNRMCLANPWG